MVAEGKQEVNYMVDINRKKNLAGGILYISNQYDFMSTYQVLLFFLLGALVVEGHQVIGELAVK